MPPNKQRTLLNNNRIVLAVASVEVAQAMVVELATKAFP